jgi:glutathione S-transferase
MKVYGHPMSTCTRRVLTTLAEKGATAEFILVDLTKGEHKQPAHLARQPFGVVPAFEDDDGFSMFESRAIMRYLDERVPGPALTPRDARGRARMEQWISIEHSYMTPVAMKIISQKLFNPMGGRATDMAVVDAGRAELARVFDITEEHLAESPYLAGDAFTLADISWMPYIEYLFAAESGDLVTSRRALGDWWGRVSERASWRKATGKAA